MKIYVVVEKIYDDEGTYSRNVKAFAFKEKADMFADILNKEQVLFVKLHKESQDNAMRELDKITPEYKRAYAEIEKAIKAGKSVPSKHVEDLNNWYAFKKECDVWSKKRQDIVNKWEVKFTSQNDPLMSPDQATEYEVEELEYEPRFLMETGQQLTQDQAENPPKPAPGQIRYGVGPIGKSCAYGPYILLQDALNCTPGGTSAGIYKLTITKTWDIESVLIYVWDMKLDGSAGWVEEA